nr:hypothetical protein [Micromonospora sp. DSM 115978]
MSANDVAVAKNKTSTSAPTAEPSEDSKAEEAPRQIAPDSLLVDDQVAEEMYGALSESDRYDGHRYEKNVNIGPGIYGDQATFNYFNGSGRPAALPIVRRLDGISELLDLYAASGVDAELDGLLRRNPTGCLTGLVNTGRFSTACAALGRRHGPERVAELLLPAGIGPEEIHRHKDLIEQDHGYVLRLVSGGYIEVLRQLADLFRRRASSLLLVREANPGNYLRHSAEVTHQIAPPEEVFRRHLRRGLVKLTGWPVEATDHEVDRYLRQVIRQPSIPESGQDLRDLHGVLRETYGPREAKAIAEAIVKRHPAGAAELEEILELSQPRRRQRAAEILRVAEANQRPPRRADQHERAFRLAYAVFHRHPMNHVFEAADRLLERIDDKAKRPDWGRMALQHPVSHLLGPLNRDWQEGQQTPDATAGGGSGRSTTRTAWLRDPGLRGAVIDVAWHEFDSTRPAILDWLNDLVGSVEPPDRRAAAETAGVLAHHDFERVCERLIDGWAGSPRWSLRQAAAWALVLAHKGGRVAPAVRSRIRDWAHGERNYQRDTAARIYASGLQQPVLDWSLADLRRIAEDRMQQRPTRDARRHQLLFPVSESLVAEGINQLYAEDRAGRIIRELAAWTGHRTLRRHAAAALLALNWRTAEKERTTPELMVRLIAKDVDTRKLARVWGSALLDSTTAVAAWRAFLGWLGHADLDEGMRLPIGELVAELTASPPLHRRMRFYVLRTSDFHGRIPDWLGQAIG